MIEVPLSQIQYYERKILGYQSQLCDLQQQLSLTKIKLRQSQQRQIKNQILLKQLTQSCERLKILKVDQAKLSQEDQQFAIKKIMDAQKQLKNKFQQKQKELKQYYDSELNKQKKKLYESSSRSFQHTGDEVEQKIKLLQFKLQKAISQKRQVLRQLDDYKQKVNSDIQNVRESLQHKTKEKQQYDRKFYRDQIQNLEADIKKLQEQLHKAFIKIDPNREKQIQRLKQQIRNNIIANAQELDKFSTLLNQKNKQIIKISDQKTRVQKQLLAQRNQSQKRFKKLQNQLNNTQQESCQQLQQTTLKMSRINEQTIKKLQDQLNQVSQTFFNQRKTWDVILEQKDQQVNRFKKGWEDEKFKAKQEKQYMKSKIAQLKQRLEQYQGSKHGGQTEQMLKSLRQYQQKKQHFDNYQNGVTFLERQVKKSIMKLQSKNIQIKNLLKQMNQMRQEFNNEKEYQKNKFQTQKKSLINKIIDLEKNILKLQELLRQKQMDLRIKSNETVQDVQKLQEQNKALKDLTKQMQRDYNRVIENKKDVQKEHRQQRQEGIHSKSQINFTKKEKWLELERQRNQLQVTYKEKQYQLRQAHQVERQRWRYSNQNLKSQLQLLKQKNSTMNQKLIQLQGVDQQQAQKERLNKYRKKTAAIQLEIALNKNFFNQISDIKSGSKRNLELSQINEIQSQSHPMDSDRRKQLQQHLDKIRQQGQKLGGLQSQQSPVFKMKKDKNNIFAFGADSFGPRKIEQFNKDLLSP